MKTLVNGVFITHLKICPLAAEKGQFALPVDRPVDRPTVKFLTVEPTGRLPGRPGLDPESNGSLAGRPPGRPDLDTESRLSVRSIARSTGGFSREQSSLAVDRPPQLGCVHTLCTSVDWPGRPPTATVDRSGRPADSQSRHYRTLKLGFLSLIKSHKIT